MEWNPVMAEVVKGVGKLHALLYRVTGGLGGVGLGLGRNTLVLTTKGRKSGRESSTPLLYLADDKRLYIVASFGGSDSAPGWYRNLVKNPEVGVQVGASRGRYRTRTLGREERDRIWPRLVALWPDYDNYQKRTERLIPVVELTPIES